VSTPAERASWSSLSLQGGTRTQGCGEPHGHGELAREQELGKEIGWDTGGEGARNDLEAADEVLAH